MGADINTESKFSGNKRLIAFENSYSGPAKQYPPFSNCGKLRQVNNVNVVW